MSECEECGMVTGSDEYHPYAACLMFIGCRDSETVRANLDAVVLHGMTADREATSVTTEQQAERIRELSLYENMAKEYGMSVFAAIIDVIKERDELAAQNQALREALQWICDERDYTSPEYMYYKARDTLADLPDLATPIINELKAKTLEEAVEIGPYDTDGRPTNMLCNMAQELRGK